MRLRELGEESLAALESVRDETDPAVRERVIDLMRQVRWDSRVRDLARQGSAVQYYLPTFGSDEPEWYRVQVHGSTEGSADAILLDYVSQRGTVMQTQKVQVRADHFLSPLSGTVTVKSEWAGVDTSTFSVQGQQVQWTVSEDPRQGKSATASDHILMSCMVFPLMTTLPFEDGFKARFEYWTPFPALDVFSAESIEYVGEEDVVHRGQKRRVRRFNYAGQAYWVTDDRQLVVWGI